jgi:hypothetical protein
MACSRMRGHKADSHNTNEGGALLQHLKKGSRDVPVMETSIDNKLHYPTNSSLQRHVSNTRNWPRLEDYY